MIGYNRLGSYGRFGNQMFQYAALRGIAANNNLDWCIPPRDTPSCDNYGLFDAFKLKNLKNVGFVNGPTYDEPGFDFDQQLFNNCPDNVNIHGFRQTEKYFANIEESIREDFEFRDEIYEPCKSFMQQFDESIIFLHVRRGDNVGRPEWYPMPTIDHIQYILEKHFSNNQQVLICSDDIAWVKNQKFFKADRFVLSEKRVYYKQSNSQRDLIPFFDLCLMSMCNGAIIANSSLSWWGAWLQKNPNKKIIAQSPWVGKNLYYIDIKDLIPNSWIIEKITDERIQK
jgi:hypothetical protein